VYQWKGHINIGCDPPGYPTSDYINRHPDMYGSECHLLCLHIYPWDLTFHVARSQSHNLQSPKTEEWIGQHPFSDFHLGNQILTFTFCSLKVVARPCIYFTTSMAMYVLHTSSKTTLMACNTSLLTHWLLTSDEKLKSVAIKF
jgi:Beta-glucan synthesis-associated protein SKN1/KRE6/Sbg1